MTTEKKEFAFTPLVAWSADTTEQKDELIVGWGTQTRFIRLPFKTSRNRNRSFIFFPLFAYEIYPDGRQKWCLGWGNKTLWINKTPRWPW